jgi:hypothetical protein
MGGIAAAGLAEAAVARTTVPPSEGLPAGAAQALDTAEVEFSQYRSKRRRRPQRERPPGSVDRRHWEHHHRRRRHNHFDRGRI